MHRFSFGLLIVILFFSVFGGASAESRTPSPGWVLVWHDEFEGLRLDPAKWNIVSGYLDKNNELQYYIPQSVALIDGYLVLTSDYSPDDKRYTSGAIETKDKFSLLYGKIEVRAKLPKGKGLFPAFWMLPAVGANYLPEIDIMEMLGDHPSEIWFVYHRQDPASEPSKYYHSFQGSDYSAEFHIFGLEWRMNHLAWFIDNEEIYSIPEAPSIPMFLYINTAVGGDWPGFPDLVTHFPQTMEIDYVRIYQE